MSFYLSLCHVSSFVCISRIIYVVVCRCLICHHLCRSVSYVLLCCKRHPHTPHKPLNDTPNDTSLKNFIFVGGFIICRCWGVVSFIFHLRNYVVFCFMFRFCICHYGLLVGCVLFICRLFHFVQDYVIMSLFCYMSFANPPQRKNETK